MTPAGCEWPDLPVLSENGGNRSRHLGLRRHIEGRRGARQSCLTHLRGRCGKTVRVAVAENNMGAGRGGGIGIAETETTRGAGNENDLALERECVGMGLVVAHFCFRSSLEAEARTLAWARQRQRRCGYF